MATYTLITTVGSGGGLTNNHPKAGIYGGTFTFVGTLSSNKIYAVCSLFLPEPDSTGAVWQLGVPSVIASGFTPNSNTVPVCQGFSYATPLYPLTLDLKSNQLSAPTTATETSVTSSATSTQLLASNANRKGATFFNESNKILYLKFGTTASATSYTVQIASNTYYELKDNSPYGVYTGRIDGIWEASPTGSVRITEV